MKPRTSIIAWTVACALALAAATCRQDPADPGLIAERDDAVSASATPAPLVASASASAAPAPPSASASAAAAPGAPVGLSPEKAKALVKRARDCWADPRCSLEDAERLYTQADEARAPNVDCFRFYYGIGVAQDERRARACFERTILREGSCGDQSPSLERLYLAAMLVHAQGGAEEIERAKALLSTCYPDLGVEGVRASPDKATDDAGAAKRFDYCEDVGGSTLSMRMCNGVGEDKQAFERQKAWKEIAPRLDEEGLSLLNKAESAWSVFVEQAAASVGDIYRNGSMRPLQESWYAQHLDEERTRDLRGLPAYTPDKDDAKEAETAMEAAYREATENGRDKEAKQLLQRSQAAWRAYRTAEVALYRHVRGKELGADAVARAVAARLARERAKALSEAKEP